MVFVIGLVCTLALVVGIVSLIEDGDVETLGLAGFLTLMLVGALLI